MHKKIICPLAEAILHYSNFSKPFHRTFVVSCIKTSWSDNDDLRSSQTMHSRHRSWEDSDDDRPGRSYRKSWDDDRPERSYRRSWDDDEQYGNRRGYNANNRFMGRNFNEYSQFNRRSSFAGASLRKPEWDSQNLKPIQKDFYSQCSGITNQSEEEVEEFRNANEMTLVGSNIPPPLMQFTDYPFSGDLSRFLATKMFKAPTPIQAQGIPIALSGQDMVGIAKTGSGKTLGYLLPCSTHVHHHEQDRQSGLSGPQGLVLGPTRELVQQIDAVASDLGRFTGMKTACVFGGASKHSQAQQLSRGPSLCIATPGRLLDFLEASVTDLQNCSFLVLDEADRMLDMGFEPQIRKIIEQIRPDRQTLMWSATWPREVQGLAADFLTNPIRLNVGSLDLVANPDIEQEVEVVESEDKLTRLSAQLDVELNTDGSKVLIFVETRRTADWLCNKLFRHNLDAAAIHGDCSQSRRDKIMKAFRRGSCRILVATDVASRGLDVDGISLVVNYDLPKNIDSYIHRIGRTGRAGQSGRALSFATQIDQPIVRELIRVLTEASQTVPDNLYSLKDSMAYPPKRRAGGRFRGPSRW